MRKSTDKREHLVIIEATSAKLIGGVLRIRGKENLAVEIRNGDEFLRMVANMTEAPEWPDDDPLEFTSLRR